MYVCKCNDCNVNAIINQLVINYYIYLYVSGLKATRFGLIEYFQFPIYKYFWNPPIISSRWIQKWQTTALFLNLGLITKHRSRRQASRKNSLTTPISFSPTLSNTMDLHPLLQTLLSLTLTHPPLLLLTSPPSTT